jgi:hypothetical protein
MSVEAGTSPRRGGRWLLPAIGSRQRFANPTSQDRTAQPPARKAHAALPRKREESEHCAPERARSRCRPPVTPSAGRTSRASCRMRGTPPAIRLWSSARDPSARAGLKAAPWTSARASSPSWPGFQIQPLPRVRAGAVECVADFVPGLWPAARDSNGDGAVVVGSQRTGTERPPDIVKQTVGAVACSQNPHTTTASDISSEPT